MTTSATVPTVEWIVNDNVDVSQTGLSYSHVASTAAGTSVTASVVVLDNTNGCKVLDLQRLELRFIMFLS